MKNGELTPVRTPRYITLMVIVIIIILCGCSKREQSSSYKVVDSNVWTYPMGLEKTFWLDNDRVIFVSKRTMAPGPGNKILTVWDTATGKVDFSHEEAGLICARNGQVVFTLKDNTTGINKYYRGQLENSSEYPMPHSGMRIDDIYDCDWVPKETWGVAPLNFPYTKKLRGNNHFITVEPKTQTSNGKTYYFEQSGSEGKELPIYLLSYSISYSEILDAYMVDNGMYDPSNLERGSFRILERNGNLRDVLFPKSMLTGRQTIYPLKLGYLSEYNDGKYSATDPGDRGLWLLQGEKSERLIVGAVHGVSISPNGCKATFIHASNSNEYFSQKKPYRTVKLIDFCKGDTKP